jgi:hypothetical protein
MIQVTVFSSIRPLDNPNTIDQFQAAFGLDLPQYMDMGNEDPRGTRYLSCVTQTPLEILSICDAMGYLCGTPSFMEIEESQFNSNYKIISDSTGYHLLPVNAA